MHVTLLYFKAIQNKSFNMGIFQGGRSAYSPTLKKRCYSVKHASKMTLLQFLHLFMPFDA